MRSEAGGPAGERGPGRGRIFAAVALLSIALAAAGCKDSQPAAAVTLERFAGVKKQAGAPASAQSAFCERSYPAGERGGRRWAMPPLRPLPGAEPAAAAGGWTWVNLWATWCTPCVEELELLGRWRDGLARDGAPVRFELVSVDDADQEQALLGWRAKGLPGTIRWLRSEGDLGPLLDALGVERNAMLPVHALVDEAGWIRCVRVGAVHEQDYAGVRAMIGR